MTSPLEAQIAREIAARGPISVERFWTIALYDREHGYYVSREPFGRAGDFTTAPEISQMFGELIGAWIAGAWTALGRPSPFLLAEIGPGRGTLMADILRTLRQAAPACLSAARIRLVEVSERLAAVQATKLEPFDLPIRRVRHIGELEDLPTILVGNELFDALAIRQAVVHEGRWHERVVEVDAEGRLAFGHGPELGALPGWMASVPPQSLRPGTIAEVSPARDNLAAEIGRRLVAHGGAGLFIDYGHARSALGDSLQAIANHRYVPVLEAPGEADLTSHVDFERLSACFSATGLEVAPIVTQGRFLLDMGLLERAGSLGGPLDEAGRNGLRQSVQRLAGGGKEDMGELFKVLACASRPIALPPFGAVTSD
ncbi:class I SAM-dependent methyltransferase [Fulvimarina endophytica]|uniref:Class I SAM-dependent methyltransferase n=1 Tax=Fulvimarina endophytica TaxID=2293836 RepID=A0A371X891_9HYPH|nr:class I SAM-dependent methyltransferase [Fulvimarina endophytica]RFC65449.1 class I SAM-dependent methyltransferase [Fulvimarina endophytica]